MKLKFPNPALLAWRRFLAALAVLAGLVVGGAQAADHGPLKYAEGPYDVASGVYTVAKSDDLDAIAERFGVTVAALKEGNKLASDQVEAGQKLVVVAGASAEAPQVTGTLGAAGATTTVNGKQLPPPDPAFGGAIEDDALQSKFWWAPRIVPPKQAPNILLSMAKAADAK